MPRSSSKNASKHTIADCLGDLGVDVNVLEQCNSLEEEFQKIKSIYRRKILEEHPDKGGDEGTTTRNV